MRCVFAVLMWIAGMSVSSAVTATDKLIVVHVRGGAFEQIRAFAEQGGEGFLAGQLESGALRPLTPIDNAVTISNIASFETGTLQSTHGIVGHTFGAADNGFAAPLSGFSVPFDAEAYWEAAARVGKRVLSIGALIGHGSALAPDSIDLLMQGQQFFGPGVLDVPESSGTHKITLSDGLTLTLARRGNSLQVIMPDGTDIALEPGDWFSFDQGRTEQGLKRTRRMQWLDDGRLYVRPAYAHRGAVVFLQAMDAAVGGSAGWPNIPMYAAGEIGPETIIDEIDAELELIMRLFEAARARQTYDLIMLDYPIMDRYGHAFQALLENDDAEERARFEGAFAEAHARLGRDLAAIEAYARQDGYRLIIASGHGFAPIHLAVNLNRVLEQAGIPTADDWAVRGFPGKVSAHLYANPALSAEEQEAWLRRAGAALEDLRDPESGDSIVDYLLLHRELTSIGHDHPRAGDLFVMLKPGAVFQPQFRSDRPLIDRPVFKGDHGFAAKYPSSLGFVITEGADITHVTDIAPAARRFLGLRAR